MPFENLTLQETQKWRETAYVLQEAATDIGVKRIAQLIKGQYVERLNEEYFGFANSSIRTMLAHIQPTW